MGVLLGILAVIIFLILVTGIKVVPQSTEYIIETLGKYSGTWTAGLHFKFPIFQRVVKIVTMKEQVMDSPPQPVITKDNVTMNIDTVVYFQVFDSTKYTYGVVNPLSALENMAATTLRNIVGGLDLDSTLTSRDSINTKMTSLLDEDTDKWGIKVNNVEVKNIIPPAEIQASMEKQMKAERDKRETKLLAEAHKEAAITRAEGDKTAMILQAEGERDAKIARAEGEAKAIYLAKKAEADGLKELLNAHPDKTVLELKRYEALVQMCDGQAAKIIIPSDIVNDTNKDVLFSEITGLGDVTHQVPPKQKKHIPDPCCNENDYKKEAKKDKSHFENAKNPNKK